jgi:hypothetical protein
VCYLLGEFKKAKLDLDFFSYHCYGRHPHNLLETIEQGQKMLEQNGFADTPAILNEWNYCKGWLGDEYEFSMKAIKSLYGSSFVMGGMLLAQKSPLAMLMYYEGRPCAWSGMFDTATLQPIKGYYPFVMFSHLYELGTAVEAVGDKVILPIGAKGENEKAIMLSYFLDDDTAPDEEVALNLKSLGEGKKILDFYLLDKDNDMRLVKTEYLSSDEATVYFNMSLFSTYLVKIR